MTQAQLAVATGIHQPTISSYESGSSEPRPENIARLLAATQMRPSLVLKRHRDEVIAIAAANRARNVRVFGSIARGQDRSESDIDLLVTFDEGASLFDLSGLGLALEALLGRRVDIVSDGVDDDAFMARIALEAIPL